MEGLVGTLLLAIGVTIGYFACKLGQVIKHKEYINRGTDNG
ncbi:hypothetical protein PBV87_15420 [Niameybacter massiliensis]|uniref:Uncharacterized protein n=1 Tax=Holtiella tumoricola TaxID=3018743 RepID=A0AA42DQ74_9FIRM|nr:hypothetical protein [Holtiella tumoricola]MDA3732866.1 hypothetical protein [Holtiella tumoricola]